MSIWPDRPSEKAAKSASYNEASDDPAQDQRAGLERGGWWHWDGRLVTSSDAAAQWIMMIFTVVAAGLLFGTRIVARNTILSTQEMARDTSRIGEAQVRAYLGVKNTSRSEGLFGNESDVFLTICNFGYSGATDVRVFGGFVVSDSSKPELPEIEEPLCFDFIYPQETVRLDVFRKKVGI